jgi:branched-chain amino acid transport system ATP-binding protein
MADLLAVDGLGAGYGAGIVIHDIGFRLAEGEAMALLGRNGTGKTTLILSILGLTIRSAGRIALAGRDITGLPTERRVAAGLGWVPQERGVFRSLTVEQNLTAVARPGAWTLQRVYALFPRLSERRAAWAGTLSGGEQQMLAIGRALTVNPLVLLLDEPLEGLAPIIAGEVLSALREILASGSVAAVIVEQKARTVLAMTERVLILDRGRAVHQGASADLLAAPERLESLLGVRETGREALPAAARQA